MSVPKKNLLTAIAPLTGANVLGGELLGREEVPSPPAPLAMPTMDTETVRRARLREIRRMVAQGQGRESTILGGARKPLGGAGKTPGGA